MAPQPFCPLPTIPSIDGILVSRKVWYRPWHPLLPLILKEVEAMLPSHTFHVWLHLAKGIEQLGQRTGKFAYTTTRLSKLRKHPFLAWVLQLTLSMSPMMADGFLPPPNHS